MEWHDAERIILRETGTVLCERNAMRTISNLAVIVTLAVISGVLKWLLGDSVFATFGSFLAVFAVVMLAFGVKGWVRWVLCAAVATAISAAYQALLPADSAWTLLGLVLLTAVVIGPLGWEVLRQSARAKLE
jgi:hypothetical protein